jgi:hypothetical protein
MMKDALESAEIELHSIAKRQQLPAPAIWVIKVLVEAKMLTQH